MTGITLGLQWPGEGEVYGEPGSLRLDSSINLTDSVGQPFTFFLSFPLPPILASLAESLSFKTKVSCILKNITENNYWNLKTKQEWKQSVPSAQLYDPCSSCNFSSSESRNLYWIDSPWGQEITGSSQGQPTCQMYSLSQSLII